MELASISGTDRDRCSRVDRYQEMRRRAVVEFLRICTRAEPEVDVARVKRIAEYFLSCVLERSSLAESPEDICLIPRSLICVRAGVERTFLLVAAVYVELKI